MIRRLTILSQIVSKTMHMMQMAMSHLRKRHEDMGLNTLHGIKNKR